MNEDIKAALYQIEENLEESTRNLTEASEALEKASRLHQENLRDMKELIKMLEDI